MTRLCGVVRRFEGGVYTVQLESGDVVDASIRGRLKLQQRTGDRVVAGDRVELDVQSDGGHTIEKVEARESQLARQDPRTGGRRAKVIVANVDQAVLVFAAAKPEPRLRMLDRFLVIAESNELEAVIVVNKSELLEPDELRARFGVYERIGYPVLYTSVKRGDGIDDLRDRLCNRTSVLTGPSGVGKSSLLNVIEPGLQLRIGEVSEAVGKGQHTTVTAELIPLRCGGFVADTPGLRELGLWNIPPEELSFLFPEFVDHVAGCKFSTCTHLHEPGCMVREAVAAGDVDAARYESYRHMRLGDEIAG